MPAAFLPVHVARENAETTASAGSLPCVLTSGVVRGPEAEDRTTALGRIEVRLPGGARVVIEGAVEPALVAAALTALR